MGGRDETARISAVTHARQKGGTSPAPTRAAAGTRLVRAPHQAVAIGDDELAGLDCPHVASSAATRGVTVVVAAVVASGEVVAAAVFATVVGWTLSCVRHRTPPARCEDDGATGRGAVVAGQGRSKRETGGREGRGRPGTDVGTWPGWCDR